MEQEKSSGTFSRDQLRNRLPLINNRSRTTVEIFDRDVRGIDAQVVVDRRQEISGAADSFDGILAAFVGRSDKASGFDAAASPNVGERSRPVISAGLLS
jgi:hypothetical protein